MTPRNVRTQTGSEAMIVRIQEAGHLFGPLLPDGAARIEHETWGVLAGAICELEHLVDTIDHLRDHSSGNLHFATLDTLRSMVLRRIEHLETVETPTREQALALIAR